MAYWYGPVVATLFAHYFSDPGQALSLPHSQCLSIKNKKVHPKLGYLLFIYFRKIGRHVI
jgi:hypothetical protein